MGKKKSRGKSGGAKTQKAKKVKESPKAYEYYSVDGDRLSRKKQFCTRCGPGYFMAEMYNRRVCGKCGFTEFIKPAGKKSSS